VNISENIDCVVPKSSKRHFNFLHERQKGD